MSDDSGHRSSLFWGVVLIGLGAIFLLDNLRLLDFSDLVRDFWPVILIAIGLKIVWSAQRERNESKKETPVAPPEENKTKA